MRHVDPTKYPPRFFNPVDHHAEFEGLYKVGGFHPVKFGEEFNDRYVVFRKLGWATRSTVWLAQDNQEDRYVVLKITMAEHSDEQTIEVTFQSDPSLKDSPDSKHVCTPLDTFTFEGPNGKHLVLVMEPLGRSFEEVIDICSRSKRDATYEPGPYGTRTWSAKTGREAAKQVALGVAHLHANRVMHRDIQPGNIMLGLTYDINSLTKDYIQHDVWTDAEESDGNETTLSEEEWSAMNVRRQFDYLNILSRSDGKPLAPNHPPYTVAGISLLDKLTFGPPPPTSFTVKLIDFGSACNFSSCNDGSTPYPLDIRAPEIILKQPYDSSADIWALACTIFRLVTLEPLIPLWMTSDADATDDEHMKNLIDRFGKLPDFVREKWTRADEVIDEEGNIKEPDPYQPDNCQFGDLWQGVRLGRPSDMGEVEAKMFCDLLGKMCDYDPEKRLTIREVLEHPWCTTVEF